MPGMHVQEVTPRLASRGRTAAIAAGLLLLLLLAARVFWPGITGPFVFDDFPNLQNLAVLDGSVDAAHLRRYLTEFSGAPGRPLSGLSFIIEDQAWPSDPLAFKRDNILFHLLAGLLVFTLVRQLGRLHPRIGSDRADLLALATTAAWLLHPIQLSTMMLVVQRMTILSSLWMLAGLVAYLACLRCTRVPPLARVVLAGASLAVFGGLAMLCKENGVLVFAFASALNLTLLRPQVRALPPVPRHVLAWGTAAPILLLATLALANLRDIAAGYSGRDFSIGERLLTEPRILFDYLSQIFIPRLRGQGIFHDDYVVSHSLLSPPATVLALAALTALVIAAWRWRARAPMFAFAVFWFLAGHLIESTVIPLELYFEHRNYLAMLGPLMALPLAAMVVPHAWRRLAWFLFVLWLAIITALSAYNATIWGDRGVLAGVWLQENPDSIRAIQFMAGYQFDEGQYDGAKATLQQGYRQRPEAGELAFQRMLADCLTQGTTPAERAATLALAHGMHYSRVVPDVVTALRNQVIGGQCKGTFSDADFEQLVQALLHNPAYRANPQTMGHLHYELSKVALEHRDLDRLIAELDASYRYRPDPSVPREQAIYLLTAGLPDDALRYLDISDNTPQPVLTRWLRNMRAFNAPLRRSAVQMKQRFDADRRAPATPPIAPAPTR
jgi:protein O-mannosyl-transferase